MVKFRVSVSVRKFRVCFKIRIRFMFSIWLRARLMLI